MARITITSKHIIKMDIINKHPDNGFSAVINALTRRTYKDILFMTTNDDGYKVQVEDCWVDVNRDVYGIKVTIECKDEYDAKYLADKIAREFKEEDEGVEGEKTEVKEGGGEAENTR
ncbi:MAG: hypothetical protein DRJ18_02260 [Candidatus Methanomethylicota archaeon]|nr:MAG: hypothetical protein DRJ18_02260 [Candidatus Verstraetearchaeota archaeon]